MRKAVGEVEKQSGAFNHPVEAPFREFAQHKGRSGLEGWSNARGAEGTTKEGQKAPR